MSKFDELIQSFNNRTNQIISNFRNLQRDEQIAWIVGLTGIIVMIIGIILVLL